MILQELPAASINPKPDPLVTSDVCILQDDDQVCIVTEMCLGGDLEHFLKVRC